MKRGVPILTGIVVFGWMVLSAVYFLCENPGALGPLGEWLARLLELSPRRYTIHHPLRAIEHLRVAVSRGTYAGVPLDVPAGLGLAVAFLALFLGTGLWLVRAVGVRLEGRVETAAVATSLGMGAWGLVVLALGAAGWLHRPVLHTVLVGGILLGLPPLLAWIRRWPREGGPRPNGPVEWGAVVLAGLALLLGLLYALTPAIQSDGLRYHLPAPELYLEQHRIVYIPFNAFTNFPFLIEMLFTFALGAGDDLAAKTMHFQCFVLAGVFVGLTARRLSRIAVEAPNDGAPDRSIRSGVLAAMIFWTTPVVLITGAWSFIDLGTALYFLATLYALIGRHGADDARDRRRWMLLAGVFLGFLVGTKYTMVAVALLVPAVLLIERRAFAPDRNNPLVGWLTNSLVVGFLALAVASPWFIKNAVFTGNPVYPLAWGVFEGGEWNDDLTEFYLAKSGQKGFHPRFDESWAMTLRHMLITPWTASIYWRLDPVAGHPGYEDFFLGPVFLLWLPLLLRLLMDVKHRSWREAPFRVLVWFLAGYVVLWYFTYQSNRMLIPALGILAVLVPWSIFVVERTGRWLAGGATAVLLAATAYNLEWSAEWVFRPTTAKPSAVSYVAGLESRDNYIRRAFEPYVMYRLMAREVPEDRQVLFVGEFRPYHCSVAWRSSDWFDLPLILHLIRETQDSDALLDRLRAEDTEYIFCNYRELARLKPRYFTGLALDYPDQGPGGTTKLLPFPPLFSEAERLRFEDLFGAVEPEDNPPAPVVHPRLRSVLTLAGMELYRIEPRAEDEDESGL